MSKAFYICKIYCIIVKRHNITEYLETCKSYIYRRYVYVFLVTFLVC